ncbi:acyltransferase family protein [Novosphingobium sediminicola]|uniref:Peptidoglycan/LPS O-acetylase OafA/YrhL n=1 Tax=Novosphingobium sediminicola TaxID=563162 RepID=A0A7W6CDW2_9SPHN|nr:acyltransferase [Novosphingobium sediminicola]MBB3954723.1 peptidoglycan/LPS O-acetylase OafA/YrhL [Novosphingobium sediminicola]
MAHMPSPSIKRLPGLELLRLVAASCVLLLHVRAVFGGQRVFGLGYLGVDFFLMLSGFLMARVQEPRLDHGAAPWSFLRRRFWRLWPMMALGGLIGLPRLWLRSADLPNFLLAALPNMALLPVWWWTFAFPLNIPAWTMTCELACNAAHVLGLWRLRRWWLIGLAAALLVADGWISWHFHGLDVGPKSDNFFWGALRCLAAYVLGIVLARWWQEEPAVPVPWWVALPLMPALLPLVWWTKAQGWWFDIGFVVLACPLMIAGAMRLDRFHRAALWLGQIAFPLFALQMPILQGIRQLGGNYWIGLGVAAAAGVLVAVLAAHISAWRILRRNNVMAM